MRARDQDLVGRQQLIAAIMQLVVGQDVVVEAFGFEPVGDVGIGRELPELRAGEAAERALALGAHIHERPQTRGIADAAAVGMRVVERAAVFDMVVQEDFVRIDDVQDVVQQLSAAAVHAEAVVAVSHVAGDRQQECDFAFGVGPGADGEPDMLFIARAAQARRIDTAF